MNYERADALKVGDYIYLNDSPTKILEINKLRIKDTDGYWLQIVHEMGSFKKKRWSRVRIKPVTVESTVVWQDFDIRDEFINKDIQKPSIVDTAINLISYYKFIKIFKRGSRICKCETITPRRLDCIACGKRVTV